MKNQEHSVEELTTHDRKVARLEAELTLLRSKYRQVLKDSNKTEAILDALQKSIEAFPEVPVPVIDRKTKSQGTPETLVLLLSDLHAGEVVSKEELGFGDGYNSDIFVARMEWLAQAITDLKKRKLAGFSYKKLVVFGLGDFVSGIIHDELTESNDSDIVQQSLSCAMVVSQFLLELAQIFEIVEFVGVYGNHGRWRQEKNFKGRSANWDYVCYQTMSLMLRNQKNIRFVVPRSFWALHDVEGHKFLILHGDNIRGWMGIPFYGIVRMAHRVSELLAARDQIFQYVCLGHFHQTGQLDRVKGEILLNGCLKGGDEYALGTLFTSGEAKQMLFAVHPKHGVTIRIPLRVENASTRPVRYVHSFNVLGEAVTFEVKRGRGRPRKF